MPEEPQKSNSEQPRRYRKIRTGVVTSDKMDKTVIVKVKRITKQQRFQKIIRVEKKVSAHDQENAYRVGDRVQIVETRPLSKTKRWRVQKLLQRTVEEG